MFAAWLDTTELSWAKRKRNQIWQMLDTFSIWAKWSFNKLLAPTVIFTAITNVELLRGTANLGRYWNRLYEHAHRQTPTRKKKHSMLSLQAGYGHTTVPRCPIPLSFFQREDLLAEVCCISGICYILITVKTAH